MQLFSQSPASRSPAFGTLVAVAVLLRLAWFLVDSQPRVVMGDSQAYLGTGIDGWFPDDRSWLYGLQLNRVLDVTGSLGAYFLIQALVSAFTIALLARFAAWLGASRIAQWVLLTALSFEPLWLHYDRAILTDSLGATLLAAGIVGSIAAVCTGRIGMALLAGAVLAWGLTMRTALVPPVLIMLIIVTAAWNSHWAARVAVPLGVAPRSAALAALAVIAATVSIMGWYGMKAGELAKTGWTLNPRSGYFLVGATAPILQAEDFQAAGFSDGARLVAPADRRNRDLRSYQIFRPDGVMPLLEKAVNSPHEASRIGGAAARHAVLRDPLGYARLVVLQYRDYVDERFYRRHFSYWFGTDRPLTPEAAKMLQAKIWEGVMVDWPHRESATLSWIKQTLWYPPVLVWLALLVPFVAFFRLRRLPPHAAYALAALALVCLGYLATLCMFGAEIAPRYLILLAPLVGLQLTLLAQSFSRQQTPAYL